MGRGWFGGRRLAAGAAILVLGGCESSTVVDSDVNVEQATFLEIRHEGSLKVFTQSVVPADAMEALYEGPVGVDDSGCIRLQSEGYGVTVVWPHGFRAGSSIEGFEMLDAEGEFVGRLGSDFRLSGGEVESLHSGLGFTAADETLAEARCPGRFWIVGEEVSSGG